MNAQMDQSQTGQQEQTQALSASSGLDLAKIATMLSLSMSPDRIALALACLPSKIEELIRDSEELQTLITVATSKQVQHDINKDTTLRVIEKNLLAKIRTLVDDTDSLNEATSALHRLEVVKQSQAKAGLLEQDPGTSLSLDLSHIGEAKLTIYLSSKNQIETINDRSMASMPYKATMDLINSKKKPLDAEHLVQALDLKGIEDLEYEPVTTEIEGAQASPTKEPNESQTQQGSSGQGSPE